MPTAALGYGDPRGSSALREVMAGYLRRVRAAAADPVQLVLGFGNIGERAVTAGIAAVGDLLRGR